MFRSQSIGLRVFLPAAMLVAASSVRGDVRLPAVISDHMVVQGETAAPIWGWAEPGEAVSITLSGDVRRTKADADGRWRVVFEKLTPGGPHQLVVEGRNRIEIDDVLVGEVWLGSGQSNMAMKVNGANDFDRERSAADLPQLRVFTEASSAAPQASEECRGNWVLCSPETVGGFSATAYFFGREIHRARKVPVGLIVSAVGGTPIESWIDAGVQRAEPKLAPFFAQRDEADKNFDAAAELAKYEQALAAWKTEAVAAKKAGRRPTRAPRNPVELRKRKGDVGGLFNGKIAPLVGYGIRGALWYQGEANSTPEKAEFYEAQLSLMVRDWRTRWGTEFPFAWVQLPNFVSSRSGWVVVREAMLNTLALPKTGMAVTIDVGDLKDIHPKNKQAVGLRLALWARATVYSEPLEYSGPMLAESTTHGRELVLKFSHAERMQGRDGALRGFELAGADKAWHSAEARVDGATIIVTSSEVPQPAAVRYAWKDDTDANLVNGAGLPASPFRTKRWD